MTASMPMASIVSIVSRTDSPLFTDEDDTANDMVSAESRLAAVSKLSRVRVESSKNSDTTVRPRSAGTLGMDTPADLDEGVGQVQQLIDLVTVEVADRQQVPGGVHRCSRRCAGSGHDFWSSPSSTPGHGDVDQLVAAGWQVLADEVGADRQLPVATVDHHRQLHDAWAAEVDHRVERGADRPSGEQHVVDEDHDAPVQVDRDLGDLLGQHRADADVVAVQRDVQGADGDTVLGVVDLLDLLEGRRPARGRVGRRRSAARS